MGEHRDHWLWIARRLAVGVMILGILTSAIWRLTRVPQRSVSPPLQPSNSYRSNNEPIDTGGLLEREDALIEQHAALLKQAGRMPEDFGFVSMVLGRYGWHTSAGASVGARAPIELLKRSTGGAFGAYSFYQPAFDQAQRSWWIHGVMEAGSDILIPINRNAAFSSCRFSRPPCVNTMNSPIGHRVAYISASDSEGRHAPIRDAVVVDTPRYPDGSLKGTLRLNKKAPGFALTYDIAILPPDYVDHCACYLSESGVQ